MGYSTPIDKKLNKSELLKNIHTQKNQPEAIPYVTSYYKKRWGFCMSQKDFNRLPNGKYRVLIKSSLKKGFLELMHSKIKGKTKKEIFLARILVIHQWLIMNYPDQFYLMRSCST